MKKLFLCLIAAISVFNLNSCKEARQSCHIQGVIGSDQYEGKRIFLVPLYGPATAETVDSIEIKDRKFEFTTDTMQMYKILLDYHYRMGIQPLLVVGEPGEVKVVIDSISHAGGTPQNDSLEQWKVRTEIHNKRLAELHSMRKVMEQQGNTPQALALKEHSDSIHLAYKNMTRQMAANLKEGVLHDFLAGLYPTTYKKKLPDGRIVTVNADTHEEIAE